MSLFVSSMHFVARGVLRCHTAVPRGQISIEQQSLLHVPQQKSSIHSPQRAKSDLSCLLRPVCCCRNNVQRLVRALQGALNLVGNMQSLAQAACHDALLRSDPHVSKYCDQLAECTRLKGELCWAEVEANNVSCCWGPRKCAV